MLKHLLRTIAAILVRVLAVTVGLLVSIYLQLGGDLQAPIWPQVTAALATLRSLVRALEAV